MAGHDPHIAARGTRFVLVFAQEHNGSHPAEDFLEHTVKRVASRDHAALFRLFERFASEGRIFNHQHFRQLDVHPALVEFKKDRFRVLGFFHGKESRGGGAGVLVLTSGFEKKQDKTPKAELERAHRIREAHLALEQRAALGRTDGTADDA